MNSYWKWKCEACGYEFVISNMHIPAPCHRCGGQWFLKVGEAEGKEPVLRAS